MHKVFCHRLKKLRTDKEISQAKLANILGTYQQTVARWERGILQPDIDMITRIANYFDVTTDYLLGLSSNISRLEPFA